MTPIEFLRAVWPKQGLYCIAVPFEMKGYNHHVFETIEAAAAYVDSIADTKNVFFGTHTLKEPRIWDPERKPRPGWRVRVQENMRSSRIFFFDLDVEEGNDKKYPTQEAAIVALKSFVLAADVPVPMLVSSGGGLHVYWIVDSEITSIEWMETAAKLKQLAHHHGLKIDNMRTTDTSSVLRVAGTFNHKKAGEPRPVLVYKQTTTVNVDSFIALVDAAIEDAGVAIRKPRAVKTGAAALLGSNIAPTFDGPPVTMRELIQTCPQIARIAEAEGKTSDEPEWYATAGALKYVVEGRKHFHHISSGHRDYNAANCDAKFDQWEKGPVSCEKMESSCGAANAHLCHSCPWLTRARYPLTAARLNKKAPEPTIVSVVEGVPIEVKITNPPLPYKRSRETGVMMLSETKDGKQYEKKIYPYDFYPIDRSVNEARKVESQQWRVHLPHGVVRDVSIPAATFVDDRALVACLANHSMYITLFQEFKTYMSAYIQELQALYPTAHQHDHLGWIEDHTKFVLPPKIIHPDGSETTAHLSKVADDAKLFIKQRGTLQRQVELMRFYNHPLYVAQQMFVLSSLASPLLFATGHAGWIVHAHGEGGASKSSALLTGASFWGDPRRYVLNCTDDGVTRITRLTHMGILNNLPLCLDEITGMKEELSKDFALSSSQSIGRKRSQRDGTPQPSLTGDERASIIMTTANKSLHQMLAVNNTAGNAAAMRVFEIEFEKGLGVHQPTEADAYLLDLYENYGWIGENYMRLVVAKIPQVRAAVVKMSRELSEEGGAKSHERFWFSEAACALVAGDIASKLQYVVYDLRHLKDWFLNFQLPYMRGTIQTQAEASSPVAVLMDYIAHINPNILQTRKSGEIGRNMMQAEFRGQLLAHQLVDQDLLYILKQDFQTYCQRSSKFYADILRSLHRAGVVSQIDKRVALGEGTPLAKGRAYCFTVNLAHPEIASVRIGQPRGE